MFWAFLSLTLGVLAISAALGQRQAALCAAVIAVNQSLCQAGIVFLDPPASIAVAFPLDAVTALFFASPWFSGRGPTWRMAMFFASFTQCLAHLHFVTTQQYTDRVSLREYGLRLNILFLIILACNSWPGVSDVAYRVGRHLQRASGRRRSMVSQR